MDTSSNSNQLRASGHDAKEIASSAFNEVEKSVDSLTKYLIELAQSHPQAIQLALEGLVDLEWKTSSLWDRTRALFYLAAACLLIIFRPSTYRYAPSFSDIKAMMSKPQGEKDEENSGWLKALTTSSEIRDLIISIAQNQKDYEFWFKLGMSVAQPAAKGEKVDLESILKSLKDHPQHQDQIITLVSSLLSSKYSPDIKSDEISYILKKGFTLAWKLKEKLDKNEPTSKDDFKSILLLLQECYEMRLGSLGTSEQSFLVQFLKDTFFTVYPDLEEFLSPHIKTLFGTPGLDGLSLEVILSHLALDFIHHESKKVSASEHFEKFFKTLDEYKLLPSNLSENSYSVLARIFSSAYLQEMTDGEKRELLESSVESLLTARLSSEEKFPLAQKLWGHFSHISTVNSSKDPDSIQDLKGLISSFLSVYVDFRKIDISTKDELVGQIVALLPLLEDQRMQFLLNLSLLTEPDSTLSEGAINNGYDFIKEFSLKVLNVFVSAQPLLASEFSDIAPNQWEHLIRMAIKLKQIIGGEEDFFKNLLLGNIDLKSFNAFEDRDIEQLIELLAEHQAYWIPKNFNTTNLHIALSDVAALVISYRSLHQQSNFTLKRFFQSHAEKVGHIMQMILENKSYFYRIFIENSGLKDSEGAQIIFEALLEKAASDPASCFEKNFFQNFLIDIQNKEVDIQTTIEETGLEEKVLDHLLNEMEINIEALDKSRKLKEFIVRTENGDLAFDKKGRPVILKEKLKNQFLEELSHLKSQKNYGLIMRDMSLLNQKFDADIAKKILKSFPPNSILIAWMLKEKNLRKKAPWLANQGRADMALSAAQVAQTPSKLASAAAKKAGQAAKQAFKSVWGFAIRMFKTRSDENQERQISTPPLEIFEEKKAEVFNESEDLSNETPSRKDDTQNSENFSNKLSPR